MVRPLLLTLIGFTLLLPAATIAADPAPETEVATLSPDQIEGFGDQPEEVRELLAAALELTTRGLGYRYGSANPDEGGMDCSGCVYHLLRTAVAGLDPDEVRRSSGGIYEWAWEAGTFVAVNGRTGGGFEMARLRPGDILFWTGTYDVGERDPPISHVMIYLGRLKEDGRRVMVGSSNGRSFAGVARHGVSVFDFRFPAATSKARFVGYAKIPGLGEPGEDGEDD